MKKILFIVIIGIILFGLGLGTIYYLRLSVSPPLILSPTVSSPISSITPVSGSSGVVFPETAKPGEKYGDMTLTSINVYWLGVTRTCHASFTGTTTLAGVFRYDPEGGGETPGCWVNLTKESADKLPWLSGERIHIKRDGASVVIGNCYDESLGLNKLNDGEPVELTVSNYTFVVSISTAIDQVHVLNIKNR